MRLIPSRHLEIRREPHHKQYTIRTNPQIVRILQIIAARNPQTL